MVINGLVSLHRRLTICPNEEKIGAESKYISVYLAILNRKYLQSANWEVDAVFSIFLLNQISGKYHCALGIYLLQE